jgi:hypothetical protein
MEPMKLLKLAYNTSGKSKSPHLLFRGAIDPDGQ